MKRSSLVLLLAAAFCASTAGAQAPRVAIPREVSPDVAPPGTLKLPTTRPGSYIAGTRPLVSPPPAGFPELVLPPSLSPGYSPPPSSPAATVRGATKKLLPASAEKGADANSAVEIDDGHATLEPVASAKNKRRATDASSAEDDTPAVPAPRKPSNVFLSRDALQKTRDKCQVHLKTGDQLKFATQGGEKDVRLSIIGGRACVKAVSVSDEWITVSALGSNDELTVAAAENEEAVARDGTIVIANTGSSVHIKVHQEPNTSGFRRIEL